MPQNCPNHGLRRAEPRSFCTSATPPCSRCTERLLLPTSEIRRCRPTEHRRLEQRHTRTAPLSLDGAVPVRRMRHSIATERSPPGHRSIGSDAGMRLRDCVCSRYVRPQFEQHPVCEVYSTRVSHSGFVGPRRARRLAWPGRLGVVRAVRAVCAVQAALLSGFLGSAAAGPSPASASVSPGFRLSTIELGIRIVAPRSLVVS